MDVDGGNTNSHTLTGLINGETYTISIVGTSSSSGVLPSAPVSAGTVVNPRRACAARVTVVVLCVCVCVRGPHLQLAQLSDKVGILAVSVSCSLVFKKGVFRTIAFWRS